MTLPCVFVCNCKEHLLPEALESEFLILPCTIGEMPINSSISGMIQVFFEEAFNNAELKVENMRLRRAMMAFARSWVLLSGSLHSI